MQKGLHASVTRNLSTFINKIVAYIYAEVASCLCYKELHTFMNNIVAYIYAEGASCLGEREILL